MSKLLLFCSDRELPELSLGQRSPGELTHVLVLNSCLSKL